MSSFSNLEFWAPAKKNNRTFQEFYTRYMQLALNLFEWELPKSVNVEYLERQLYNRGAALFFKSANYGYMCLGFTSARLNPYGEPVEFWPIANNGEAVTLVNNAPYNADNAVMIKNNTLRKPTSITILHYANDLFEIKQTLDVNLKQQRMPGFITCEESVRHTLNNVLSKIEGGKPLIMGDKSLRDEIKIDYISTGAPFIIDKLRTEWHETVNELLTFLGIENANRQKRERLNTDEVNANNEYTDLSASVMLACRERACVAINDMFPDVKARVKFNSMVKDPDKEVEKVSKLITGGENSGYNDQP